MAPRANYTDALEQASTRRQKVTCGRLQRGALLSLGHASRRRRYCSTRPAYNVHAPE